MRASEIIKASINSHQDWIDFVTDNPEYCGETHGDAKFHQDRIKDYNLAIAEIEQLQAELEQKSLKPKIAIRANGEIICFAENNKKAVFVSNCIIAHRGFLSKNFEEIAITVTDEK